MNAKKKGAGKLGATARPYIIETSEYKRTKQLDLHCTQLNETSSVQARILDEWCEFFHSPSPVRSLKIGTRCPQRRFDSVCQQSALTELDIHWGPISDLSPIRNLKNLQRLRLGSCSITDLKPIESLKLLDDLALGNLDRLSDYSSIAKLKNLERLRIEGAPFMPKKVWIDDLSFIRRLPKLRTLALTAVRFRDAEYSKAFKGLKLECFDFYVNDAVLRANIIKMLPQLKSGRILEVKR